MKKYIVYKQEIQKQCTRDEEQTEEIEDKWKHIKEIIGSVAEGVLGYERKEKRNDWFDEERYKKLEEKNRARTKMIERRTRHAVEEYKQKREAKNICKRKKNAYKRKMIA